MYSSGLKTRWDSCFRNVIKLVFASKCWTKIRKNVLNSKVIARTLPHDLCPMYRLLPSAPCQSLYKCMPIPTVSQDRWPSWRAEVPVPRAEGLVGQMILTSVLFTIVVLRANCRIDARPWTQLCRHCRQLDREVCDNHRMSSNYWQLFLCHWLNKLY